MYKLLILVVISLNLSACAGKGPKVGSYIDGREVLGWQQVRVARPEMVEDCLYLNQTFGDSKFNASWAREQALQEASHLGANAVVVVESLSVPRGSSVTFVGTTAIANNYSTHTFAMDAYYCDTL